MRQGLMQADSVLLEPVYGFRLEVPERMLGRAMTDVERMHGQFEPPVMEGEYAVLSGSAPVACMDRKEPAGDDGLYRRSGTSGLYTEGICPLP